MARVHQPVDARVEDGRPEAVDVDAWLVPVFEGDDLEGLAALERASGGELAAARRRGEFSGKAFETVTCRLSGDWTATHLIAVGAGPRKDCSAAVARRVAAAGALEARARHLARLGVLWRGSGLEEVAQALVEGVHVANYDPAALKSGERPQHWIDSVTLHGDASSQTLEAVRWGAVLGEATNQARELVNEPGNVLTPRAFAGKATQLAAASGARIEVLDEQATGALGMGLLAGVARGSREPSRLIVITHSPAGVPAAGPVLGLVGKGITFDSGGISIKPAEQMDKMKGDMAGGAAVVAAVCALARLGLPLRVIGVVPATENLPGGDAMKPGDVLTSASGKTVEILNTDAEGRLVLGDGLWYAQRLGATHLVDVATLTGACMVALGKTTTGLFAAPDTWGDAILAASDRAGERTWRMPVFDDYRELFKSDVADFANTGGRYGGAITAALFVKEFAGDLPWAHLDIAGPSWADEAKPYQPKGATGSAVRTLAELARALAGSRA